MSATAAEGRLQELVERLQPLKPRRSFSSVLLRDHRREAERWLRQAHVDLGAARRLADDFSALACFHAQQAAGKALKAILYGAGERVVLGHSLAQLGARVVEQAPG